VLVGVDVLLVGEPVLLAGEPVLLPGEPLLLRVVVVPEPDMGVEPETLPVYEIVEVSSENVVVAEPLQMPARAS